MGSDTPMDQLLLFSRENFKSGEDGKRVADTKRYGKAGRQENKKGKGEQ